MPAAKADWHQVAEDYITGTDDVTYLSLSRKYSVAWSTVQRHGANEKWVEKRDGYRQRVAERSIEKAVNQIANERAEQITRNRKSLQLAQGRLIEAIQSGDLKANSLDSAARALVEVIRGMEFVEGEPDSRQEVKVDGSSTVIAALGDNPEGVRLLSELAGRLASRPTQSGESAKQPE